MFRKRISQKTDGSIVIKSENPSYPDEVINPEVVSIFILGRVIEITHQL